MRDIVLPALAVAGGERKWNPGSRKVSVGFLMVSLYTFPIACLYTGWNRLCHGIRGSFWDFAIASSDKKGLNVHPLFFSLPILGWFVRKSISIHEQGIDEPDGMRLEAQAFCGRWWVLACRAAIPSNFLVSILPVGFS